MIFQGLDSRVALYQILTFVRVLIDSISGSRFSLTVAAVYVHVDVITFHLGWGSVSGATVSVLGAPFLVRYIHGTLYN